MRNQKDVTLYINEKIEKNIIKEKLIQNEDKIVVAVSGGPDSMCLLNVLNNLKEKLLEKYNIKYELVVAHVNHMIRKESEAEKIYVENFCKKLNVPFYYLKEDVPSISKRLKMSDEMCGRKVRYEFFDKVCKECNATKIATAHNLDDDVETILLNIIRGCGINGLTGMNFKYKNIIRPLLNIEKKDILEYNGICNLNPCIDKTNFENIYVRNKIRNILIPTLKSEYNSNIVGNIIRMKKLASQDEEFLEEYTDNIVKRAILNSNDTKYVEFDFSEMINEHESIKNRFLRRIIKDYIGNLDGISSIHITDMLELLQNNIKGKKYIIGNKFMLQITRKNVARISS